MSERTAAVSSVRVRVNACVYPPNPISSIPTATDDDDDDDSTSYYACRTMERDRDEDGDRFADPADDRVTGRAKSEIA